MKHNLLKLLLSTLCVAITLPAMAQANAESSVQTTTTKSPATTPAKVEPVSKSTSLTREQKRAQKKEALKNQPKISTEFGLGVGARYNFFEMQSLSEGFAPNMSMQFSGGAALQFRLNIGRSFGFQPEISYARSTLKISGTTSAGNFSTKVKSNIVQIPMLLSVRIAMFRINAGPVFTLMDSSSYSLPRADDDTIQQMSVGRIYPAITYTAGISVKFAKVLMLDLRYADQFKDIKTPNEYVWTLDESKQAEAYKFRTSSRSIQLRFGVVF